ncbi:hypothetical protein BGZ80_005731, partial [Entomortierella chlamydospora]
SHDHQYNHPVIQTRSSSKLRPLTCCLLLFSDGLNQYPIRRRTSSYQSCMNCDSRTRLPHTTIKAPMLNSWWFSATSPTAVMPITATVVTETATIRYPYLLPHQQTVQIGCDCSSSLLKRCQRWTLSISTS